MSERDPEIEAIVDTVTFTRDIAVRRDRLAAAISALIDKRVGERREMIGQAIDLIHVGDDYDGGMRLLCKLAGRKDRFPIDVRTISMQEVARGKETT